MDVHKLPLNQVYSSLHSSAKGLSTLEAQKRLEQYGQNKLESTQKHTLLLKFLKQFTNFFALLLLFGAGIAAFAETVAPHEGYMYIAWALVGVTIFNAIFTFLQQFKSEKIMATFQKMLPAQADVLRDNKRQSILLIQLVPGDIIFLSEGDKVPADARLLEQNLLKVDHSAITGESEPQLRTIESTHENILETRNVVLSGTLVQSGDGKAMVFATGNMTQMGKIAQLTRKTEDISTPLHKEINRFIRIISIIAIVLGIAFFGIGAVLGHGLLPSLIFAIGIIVANVPEGLLPTVTLALSIGAKRMAKKNALIRDLEAVETLGSTTVICTDKTGTLTQNKMEVSSLYTGFEEYILDKVNVSREQIMLLLKTMVLCNNAHTQTKSKGFFGDPTEIALLSFASRYVNVKMFFKTDKRVHELPFESGTKRMITLNKVGHKTIAYIKGAPEVVVEKCSFILVGSKVVKMNLKQKRKLHLAALQMAFRGERVLAFAYKETGMKLNEDNFVFVGLTGMTDPIREGVVEAIEKCKTAGIRVIMITGDHSITAESIARKIGLIERTAKAIVVTGEQLERMDETKLKRVLKKQNVLFARTNPVEKLRIVQALQAMGEVVTVTGDGVNDAPALKHADMGVAMGASGTEVAREAADMILMDDHFATIVNAVEEGRTIFDNIRKFINYILTSNVPEIIPFIAFALLDIPLAITVILILCIDLGTDMLPAIALGSEKSEVDVMKNKPIPRGEHLLTRNLLLHSYLFIGVIQTLAGFFAFFGILLSSGWQWGEQFVATDPLYQKAVTAFFAAVVVCQIANVFISRTRRQSLFRTGLFSNKFLWLGVFVEVMGLGMIVYLPQTQAFFGTQPLNGFELMLGLPFAIFIFFFDEIRKLLLRKKVVIAEKYFAW